MLLDWNYEAQDHSISLEGPSCLPLRFNAKPPSKMIGVPSATMMLVGNSGCTRTPPIMNHTGSLAILLMYVSSMKAPPEWGGGPRSGRCPTWGGAPCRTVAIVASRAFPISVVKKIGYPGCLGGLRSSVRW